MTKTRRESVGHFVNMCVKEYVEYTHISYIEWVKLNVGGRWRKIVHMLKHMKREIRLYIRACGNGVFLSLIHGLKEKSNFLSKED